MTNSNREQLSLATKRARKHARRAVEAMLAGEEFGTARIIPDQAYIRRNIQRIFKETVEGITDAMCRSNADRIFQQAYNQASLNTEIEHWDELVKQISRKHVGMDTPEVEAYAVARLTKDLRKTKSKPIVHLAHRPKRSDRKLVKSNSHMRKQ